MNGPSHFASFSQSFFIGWKAIVTQGKFAEVNGQSGQSPPKVNSTIRQTSFANLKQRQNLNHYAKQWFKNFACWYTLCLARQCN